MNVLMFGWEFPPAVSGGLGTACEGLTRGLAGMGVGVILVLPRAHRYATVPGMTIVDGSRVETGDAAHEAAVKVNFLDLLLTPYMTPGDYEELRGDSRDNGDLYGPDIYAEVIRYGVAARTIAAGVPFEVIHAHDWMTVPAAIEAKRVSGKPLILHIHSLESDRSGMRLNEYIYGIEHTGLHGADHVIAVSHYTRRKIVDEYGVSGDKITVVHNAVSRDMFSGRPPSRRGDMKTVLFLGRITAQKGPDVFLAAARRILDVRSDVRFVMAGAGDMMEPLINDVTRLRLEKHVIFTGFLTGEEVEQAYRESDLYVLSSVSDPFGITALEAIACDVPVIISTHAGVGEVLPGCPKVDCTDIDEMARTIGDILDSEMRRADIVRSSAGVIARETWSRAAAKVVGVYNQLIL